MLLVVAQKFGRLNECLRGANSHGLHRAAVGTVGNVIHVFRVGLQPRRTFITVAAIPGTTFAMMRQVFLVPVDANQVLECSGDSCLLVGLQLWQVHHDIRVDHFTSDKILMTAASVRLAQVVRVVHGDAELARFPFQRLKQAALAMNRPGLAIVGTLAGVDARSVIL